jgi:hypothetical protein
MNWRLFPMLSTLSRSALAFVTVVSPLVFLSGCNGVPLPVGIEGSDSGPGAPVQDGSAETTTETSTTATACSWPASLDDAGPRQCHAARASVSCELPGGETEVCLSDDPTTCPGASDASCTDLCHADEYAVACGGVGPAPSPSLPAGCRSLPPNPGGGISGCCPCETTSPAGSACKAAGGTCVLGSVTCADQAPSSAQDCNPDKNPGGAFCCLEGDAAAGDDGSESGSCADGSDELIVATNYDQSCKTTSDCVAVGVGDVCYPCEIECPSAAINVGAHAKYLADVAKTPAGSETGEFCGCPAYGTLSCVAGQCILCRDELADGGCK